ncbi:uncharacterized protein AB675_4433 [Cyphellophora attinorum]|uniref:Aldehyde dehydrogenase domain-containing protein n=1 Tax=Cyphellophora attinorum TaxID=1664694 RepID=A0A0N1HJG6_9EURO|nr:uncharacterized protein AB675_4433 [Phialophora attinorum]KPI36600.1 hypothetical protein AB675_4433 [Phialophora attinorum]
MASSPEITAILSTVSEGRTKDLRYRQRQLLSLHSWIDTHATEIAGALAADDGRSPLEAEFVLSAVLNELRHHYESLDLKKELAVEYSIKKGKENPDRRVAEDLVYLVPARSSLVFSVLVVLCASIAAGCCFIVEATPDVLRRLFSESLDRRAFITVSNRPIESVLRSCLVVDQANSSSSDAGGRILTCDSQRRAVAIVDRSADLDLAAKEIAASRYFVGGEGDYAPDLVLVNEFARAEFLEAWSKHCTALSHARSAMDGSCSSDGALHPTLDVGKSFVTIPRSRTQDPCLMGRKQHSEMKGEGLRLDEISTRQDLNFDEARRADTVTLLAYTSLDDAIDSLATVQQNALPALYVFADLAPAKYLSHFIKTHVSFVNHIPANLLIGPVAPSGYPVSTESRYRREMFESPSPQFVNVAANELGVADAVEVETRTYKRWHEAARSPLKPTGQPREGDVNFFVQGLRAAIVVYVLPVALIGIFGAGFMGKKALSYLKAR